MLIEAPFAVTLGGVALLSTDDYVESEPTLAPAGIAESVGYLRASYGYQIGRGGITHTLTFARVKYHATNVAALTYQLTHLRALPLCAAPAELVITLRDGTGWRLADTVLMACGPGVVESERFRMSYTLRGGELTAIATADYEVTEGGDQQVDEAGTGDEITE